MSMNSQSAAIQDELKLRAVLPPISEVKNDNLDPKSMMSVIYPISKSHLNIHNIDQYNSLINNGIATILSNHFNIDRTIKNVETTKTGNTPITSFRIFIQFSDTKIGTPHDTDYLTGNPKPLYPVGARRSFKSYSGPITLTAKLTIRAQFADGRTEDKVATVNNVHIGNFPVMIGGINCHTNNLTKDSLRIMGEDPTCLGGYFIIGGREYVVNSLENIKYNAIHIHQNVMPNEYVRGELLSQPGGVVENSSQIRIRYMKNGQITIVINSTKFDKVRLPFYIIYRLFGMTSDREITETIVFDMDDTSLLTVSMLTILEKAFHSADTSFTPLMSETNRARLVQAVAARISKRVTTSTAYTTNDSAMQYMNEDLLGSPTKSGGLDKSLLPHMGQTEKSRINKLKFIGVAIRKILMVQLKAMPATDRDACRNKRAVGVGGSFSKALKTQLNNNLIMGAIRVIWRELKNNQWSTINSGGLIDIFRQALTSTDLTRALEQAITVSNSTTVTVGNKVTPNRVSAQALERKNGLNTISQQRQIVAQDSSKTAKGTTRADMMRRAHSTFVGYICLAHSNDTGPAVGMNKQLAISASITGGRDSLPLKIRLLSDPELKPLENIISRDLIDVNVSRVYVNGALIGSCTNSYVFVSRYRGLRREGRIVDPLTTIYIDPITNEIEFWSDMGRLFRPLLIVDNNLEEYNQALYARYEWKQTHSTMEDAPERIEFVQNVRFTLEHAYGIMSGKITVEDLVKDGIAEFITAEEQENCMLAKSIQFLFRDRNNVVNRYTHCDVEQAVMGMAAHLSPFGNHTQPARITLETNQARQTGGWYALNLAHRIDKNRFFQFYNEYPIVSTIVNSLMPPNGMNVIVAYTSYGGNNQEDSVIVKQEAVDRGMFTGLFVRFERAELERGESFATPDPSITKNMKPNASYEKLVDGLIPVGSDVVYGVALIGRIAKLTRGRGSDDKFQFTDRSLIYKMHEPAKVVSAFRMRGPNDDEFAIIKLQYNRQLQVGDKLSSRSGNKSIVATLKPQADMPFMESGIVPDIIVNPHSIPTRMTIGQLIETTISKVGAVRGTITDGTAFLPVDHQKIVDDLLGNGFRYNGKERMYNGITGEYMEGAIFVGPTNMQLLQKFVIDDQQAVGGSGPTDAITGQPLGGKRIQGGLKLGEMEQWAMMSHGSMMNLFEKVHTDSDGRTLYVCRRCGQHAVANVRENIYQCRKCVDMADISSISSTKSSILFQQEIAAANMQITLGLRPRTFDMYMTEGDKKQ